MATESTNLLLSLFALGDSSGNGFTDWGESANFNFERLEAAITNQITKTVTTANVTLTEEEGANLFLKTDGVLTGNRAVLLPARKHLFVAYNGCTGAFNLTFNVLAQTGVTLAQGRYAILYCDGTTTVDLLADLYHKTTILGTVSQSSSVPTGAIIEHSEGTPAPSGDYVDLIRFADGTQIVRGRVTLLRASTTVMQAVVSFPKNFVDVDYTVNPSFCPEAAADAANTYAANCSLNFRELLAPVHGTKLVSAVVINAYGISGAGAFGAPDELYVNYTVTGRWF
jgi:hypothetical protein